MDRLIRRFKASVSLREFVIVLSVLLVSASSGVAAARLYLLRGAESQIIAALNAAGRSWRGAGDADGPGVVFGTPLSAHVDAYVSSRSALTLGTATGPGSQAAVSAVQGIHLPLSSPSSSGNGSQSFLTNDKANPIGQSINENNSDNTLLAPDAGFDAPQEGAAASDAAEPSGVSEPSGISEPSGVSEVALSSESSELFTVIVSADGERYEFETPSKLVSELFAENGITVGEKDRVEGAYLDGTIDSELYIKVVRVSVKNVSEEITVAPKVIYRENPDLAEGKENVLGEGAAGKNRVEYVATYEDGVVVSKQLIQETVLVEPISRLVERGTAKPQTTTKAAQAAAPTTTQTAQMAKAEPTTTTTAAAAQATAATNTTASMNKLGFEYTQVLDVTCTAYTASKADTGKGPGDPGFGITKSGMKAQKGVVAVDPRVIPLGTRLYIDIIDESIEDYGYCIAGDTGSAIKGNIIDLYFDADRQTLLDFGRRKAKVYILK